MPTYVFKKYIVFVGGTHAIACMWRSENDLKVSVLTFFHVTPRIELTQSGLVAGSFMH